MKKDLSTELNDLRNQFNEKLNKIREKYFYETGLFVIPNKDGNGISFNINCDALDSIQPPLSEDEKNKLKNHFAKRNITKAGEFGYTYFNGKNIYTDIVYSVANKELKDKVKSIRVYGSCKEGFVITQMTLLITFNDGTSKNFDLEQNEDGSFPPDAKEKALKQADEYLGTLITKTSPKQ